MPSVPVSMCFLQFYWSCMPLLSVCMHIHRICQNAAFLYGNVLSAIFYSRSYLFSLRFCSAIVGISSSSIFNYFADKCFTVTNAVLSSIALRAFTMANLRYIPQFHTHFLFLALSYLKQSFSIVHQKYRCLRFS